MFQAHAIREAIRGRSRSLSRRALGNASLAIIDQAAVGGATFLVTLLVGRMCGPAELGVYSLGMTIAWLVLAAQESLITTPYTVYGNRLGGETRRTYAGNVLLHFVVLHLLGATLLAGAAAVFQGGFGPHGMARVTWVLIGVVPLWLLRELGRRFAFADLDVKAALYSSGTCAVVQIVVVSMLAITGKLTAVTAFCAIGLGGGIAGFGWLVANRHAFQPQTNRTVDAFRTNWKLGKWFLPSQLVAMLAGIFPQWATVVALDEAAVGVLAACFVMIRIANPLFSAVNNILTPYVARGFGSDGPVAVQRIVARATWFLVSGLILFGATLFLVGDVALGWLFGSEYTGQRWTITALAVGQCAAVAGIPVGRGLQVFERPDVNFKTQLVSFSVTVLLTISLIGPFGILGAAWGFAAGAMTDTLLLVLAYRAVLRERLRLAKDAGRSTEHLSLEATSSPATCLENFG